MFAFWGTWGPYSWAFQVDFYLFLLFFFSSLPPSLFLPFSLPSFLFSFLLILPLSQFPHVHLFHLLKCCQHPWPLSSSLPGFIPSWSLMSFLNLGVEGCEWVRSAVFNWKSFICNLKKIVYILVVCLYILFFPLPILSLTTSLYDGLTLAKVFFFPMNLNIFSNSLTSLY